MRRRSEPSLQPPRLAPPEAFSGGVRREWPAVSPAAYHCNPVSRLVRFFARSGSVTAIRAAASSRASPYRNAIRISSSSTASCRAFGNGLSASAKPRNAQ